MGVGGQQDVPGIAFGNAYRFTGRPGGGHDGVVGFVYKHRHGPDEWEAIVVGSPAVGRGLLRREAVEAALAAI